MTINQKIIPHLWFDRNAEEAVNYYVSLFANSKITAIARYGDAGPGPKGSVMSIGFVLNGQEFAAINGGPQYQHSAAMSLLIWCDSQAEIDELYGKLLAGGGKEQACGWVQDRFGPIWQVNYKRMPEMIGSGDSAAATRVMQAMMTMKKIDVKKLEDAYAGA
ncbi:MAG TPA: VOC family protein [Rhizomicrobium sp.]|nr:VOC family protein [Rhizomicrobium sp.]